MANDSPSEMKFCATTVHNFAAASILPSVVIAGDVETTPKTFAATMGASMSELWINILPHSRSILEKLTLY